jgi:hypothetical protein
MVPFRKSAGNINFGAEKSAKNPQLRRARAFVFKKLICERFHCQGAIAALQLRIPSARAASGVML